MAHIPTTASRNMVKVLISSGKTQKQLCQIMEISLVTLHKHYRKELDHGTVEVYAKIADTIAEIAMDKNHPKVVEAGKFFLKARAGWRETESLEVTGADGGPIQTEKVNQRLAIDPRTLSPEEREALSTIVAREIEHRAMNEEADDAEFEPVSEE